jgi:hypothetical protein
MAIPNIPFGYYKKAKKLKQYLTLPMDSLLA